MPQEIEHPLRHKVFTVVGIVLCVILIPVVLINCTLIFKQFINKDEVPSIGGVFPMIVLTDSMAGTFNGGSLIFCSTVDAKDVHVGEIICFYDPAGSGTTTTTHRVQEIKNTGGTISFVTKGDANNSADSKPVTEDKLIGRYMFHIAGLGSVAMFMQTTPGLVIFALVPIILLVAYDVLKRRGFTARNTGNEALLAELEALRAEKAAREGGRSLVPLGSEAQAPVSPAPEPVYAQQQPQPVFAQQQYEPQQVQPAQPAYPTVKQTPPPFPTVRNSNPRLDPKRKGSTGVLYKKPPWQP